jgi:hypothetical protein
MKTLIAMTQLTFLTAASSLTNGVESARVANTSLTKNTAVKNSLATSYWCFTEFFWSYFSYQPGRT